MCGIVGYIGRGERAMDVLVDGLRRLEYRGYDSAGVAIFDDARRIALDAVAPLPAPIEKAPQIGFAHLVAGHRNLGIGSHRARVAGRDIDHDTGNRRVGHFLGRVNDGAHGVAGRIHVDDRPALDAPGDLVADADDPGGAVVPGDQTADLAGPDIQRRGHGFAWLAQFRSGLPTQLEKIFLVAVMCCVPARPDAVKAVAASPAPAG